MRVVIGEDSALFREGLAALLETSGYEVVGRSENGADVLGCVRRGAPDVVILDVRMPNDDEGILAALEVRAEFPRLPVMLLSQHVETRRTAELMTDGGIGYLLKDRVLDVEEFLAGLRRVAAGGTALDPEVIARLVGVARTMSGLNDLTFREQDVLSLMAQGWSNSAIAARLFLSPRTVETHIGSIFTKLDIPATSSCHRRVRAILAYLQGR